MFFVLKKFVLLQSEILVGKKCKKHNNKLLIKLNGYIKLQNS